MKANIYAKKIFVIINSNILDEMSLKSTWQTPHIVRNKNIQKQKKLHLKKQPHITHNNFQQYFQ